MASEELLSMLDELDENIDDLEMALAPLLNANLNETASKLPLLDKAKVHVLTTYAIESIIFSSLKVKGIDAKEHPVWTELTRVKQYFEKISEAEKTGDNSEKSRGKVDKPAAGRFIKHALAGNEKLDREREAHAITQRANAQIKLQNLEEEMTAEKARAEKQVAKEAKRDRKRKATEAESGASAEAVPDATGAETAKKKSKTKDKVKHKSDKAPKSHKEIFKDLVGRADKKSSKVG